VGKLRAERAAKAIKNEVARVFLAEIKDPRIGFVTVTKVEPTDDLQFAKIFVSVMGTESQKRTSLAGIESCKGLIRTAVGRVLKIRSTPEIAFVLDESIDKSIRISDLIRRARASDPGLTEDAEEPEELGEPAEPQETRQ